ncbi:MAG: PAS domain-containing protein [Chloroflexaceae bacterium]|nr:PAS domain-containing protein [Chloroflexaceae bacterium]
MVIFLSILIIIIASTALATFVATRAWDYRPSRFFVILTGTLVFLNSLEFIRAGVVHPEVGYTVGAIAYISLILVNVTVLIMFILLFVPHWWKGTQPVRWIILPYGAILILVVVDLLLPLDWFFNGVSLFQGIYRVRLVYPGGNILLVGLLLTWGIHIGILVKAFVRMPHIRVAIGLLVLSLLISLAGDTIVASFRLPGAFASVVKSLPIICALAYLVLRTRLLTPTRAALDLAIRAMHDPVMVFDLKNTLVYANPSATALGLAPGHSLSEVLHEAEAGTDPDEIAILSSLATSGDTVSVARKMTLAGRQFLMRRTPVSSEGGQVVGALLMGRDITEVEQHTAQLERERAQLDTTVHQLEAEQQERASLAATIRSLSLPVIPVLEGVLVLPLIGEFDARRVSDFMGVLLSSIERYHAHVVLIDITGLPLLDPEGAAGLVQSVQAAALLGTHCVLVGVRPEIAESLVSLGISLDTLATAATLQQALQTTLASSHDAR